MRDKIRIGSEVFDRDRTHVMGILNVTPDSFSDGGRYNQKDRALYHAREMIEQGAHVLDVGGESTRPGHEQISDDQEISRIAPILELLKKEFQIPLSADTYKPAVARAAIDAGADLINDIWGLKHDEQMAKVIADAGVACCLMHNRAKAGYQDFMQDMKRDLNETLSLARAAGIQEDRILLDPGIGFGKSRGDNLEAVGRLDELQELGFPILLGASRKSFIGLTLDLPVEERLEGTLVTTVYAVLKGAAFVRVHDVKENVRAIAMAQALQQGWR